MNFDKINIVTIFFTLTTIISSSGQVSNDINKDGKELNWTMYQDTVNIGFVLSFEYPNNLVAESIENARCVGVPFTDHNFDSDVTNSMQWCIWMEDTTNFPMEKNIAAEKSLLKGQVSEKRDTIIIDNVKAIRVCFTSTNPDDPYRQIIYLKKYSTMFEIINRVYETCNHFETFCNSLKIFSMNGN